MTLLVIGNTLPIYYFKILLIDYISENSCYKLFIQSLRKSDLYVHINYKLYMSSEGSDPYAIGHLPVTIILKRGI